MIPRAPVPLASVWRTVFDNDAAVEVEIGPGRGDVLLHNAAVTPAHNFFGIEPVGAEAVMARARRRGLDNVRVIRADARCVVPLIPDASVTSYHVYFPDPWPKNHHRARRLFHGELASHLRRTLAPAGTIHLATDLPALLATMCAALAAAGLRREIEAAPPPGRPTTVFERRYARGQTHYARFRAA